MNSSLIPLIAVMGVICAALWVIDVRSHRLPNALVYPLYPVALMGLAFSGAMTHQSSWRSAAIGMLIWGGLVAGLHALSRGQGMGMGDVKLAPVLGAVTGWVGVAAAATGLMAAFVLGGLWALGCLVRGKGRQARIAFGPFLVLGWMVGMSVMPGQVWSA